MNDDISQVHEFVRKKRNFLSSKDEDLNVPAAGGYQKGPIHMACQEGFSDIVWLLLKYGAKPNLLSAEGYYPMFYAAKLSNPRTSISIFNALEAYTSKSQLQEMILHQGGEYKRFFLLFLFFCFLLLLMFLFFFFYQLFF